ncbi:hypothetical protein ACVNHC_04770 [Pannonibacter sp. Q-1]|nr:MULTISPECIES: hypothetical protein [Pannonibacter]
MAKGQKRSTREIRKPKQDKTAAKAAPVPFANSNKPGTSPFPKLGTGKS